MSSGCTLLNSSSPTSTQRTSRAGPSDTDRLFSKYTFQDSQSPRSTAHFKKPSAKPTISKWKAALARLTPPRLRLLPRHPAPIKSATACVDSPSEPMPSAAIGSSSAALASDLSSGFLASDTSVCAGFSTDSRVSASSIRTSSVAIASYNFCTLPDSSLDAANDVEKLLHIVLDSPLPEDIVNRTHALAALCALCVSSPNNASRCVRAGGVQLIINILRSTGQSTNHPAPATVEESEKALLLLQLLTSSSEDGCTSALQHSSSLISTLGKKLLRSSESCTASAIAVLTALCRHKDAALFRKAVSETAVPSKLVVVLQVASKESTKRRAGKLLRLLAEPQQQHTINSQLQVVQTSSLDS